MGDDVDAKKVAQDIEDAVASDTSMLWFTDRRGHRYGVSTERLAYVELGATGEERHVGFRAT